MGHCEYAERGDLGCLIYKNPNMLTPEGMEKSCHRGEGCPIKKW